MPLAALIFANDGESAETPPILLPIAGQTQLEFLARTVHESGARHIILFTSRLPSGVIAAIDRLRADGVSIDVVRSARDAADSIHPDENLILLPGAVFVSPQQMNALVSMSIPSLLVVPDAPDNTDFERIDARDRWTGLALLDGALLRETATMLGEWQLGSTLMRMALQRQAVRVAPLGGQAIAAIATVRDAQAVGRILAKDLEPEGDDWVDRWLVAPIVSRSAAWAMGRQIPVGLVALLAIAMLAIGIGLGFAGFLVPALILLIFATLPAGLAAILDKVGARKERAIGWFTRLQNPALCAVLAGWNFQLWRQNGAVLEPLLSLWLISVLLLMWQLRGALKSRPKWLPGANAIALILMPFALAGPNLIGLALCLAYLLSAQIWIHREIVRT